MHTEHFDTHSVTELTLFAENDRACYKHAEAIKANLAKRVAKGTYDTQKAVKLWGYWSDRSAQAYAKEFATAREWYCIFTPNVRREAARRKEEEERSELG